MTTIISRLFADAETAEAAARELRAAGHDPATIRIVSPDAQDSETSLAARIAAAGVGSVSAGRYAAAVAADPSHGGSVLVVRAPFTPFGRARSAIRIADAHAPVAVAGVNANQHVANRPDPRIFHPAIGRHAHVMTRDMPPYIERRRGTVSSAFGVPLLWRRSMPRAALLPGKAMSRLFWPLPLIWRRRPSRGTLATGRHLSRLFWPMPLLPRR